MLNPHALCMHDLDSMAVLAPSIKEYHPQWTAHISYQYLVTLDQSLTAAAFKELIELCIMGVQFKFSTALLCTALAVLYIPAATARLDFQYYNEEIAENNGIFKFWWGTNYVPISTPREYDVLALQASSPDRDGKLEYHGQYLQLHTSVCHCTYS